MESDPKRASWQTEPCPTWRIREHHDDDHPDDRYHDSVATEVPTLFASRDHAAGPGQWAMDSGDLMIVTSRHIGSTEVITFLGRDDRLGQALTMTPDSAARLAEALSRHVAAIRNEQ